MNRSRRLSIAGAKDLTLSALKTLPIATGGPLSGIDGQQAPAYQQLVLRGRGEEAARTGTGLLANNHYAAVTPAPDGSLYIATIGGLVRVRDG